MLASAPVCHAQLKSWATTKHLVWWHWRSQDCCLARYHPASLSLVSLLYLCKTMSSGPVPAGASQCPSVECTSTCMLCLACSVDIHFTHLLLEKILLCSLKTEKEQWFERYFPNQWYCDQNFVVDLGHVDFFFYLVQANWLPLSLLKLFGGFDLVDDEPQCHHSGVVTFVVLQKNSAFVSNLQCHLAFELQSYLSKFSHYLHSLHSSFLINDLRHQSLFSQSGYFDALGLQCWERLMAHLFVHF